MKSKYFYIITFLLIVSITNVFSQVDVEIDKKEFKTEKDGFRDAWKDIREGDYFYALATKGDYMRAVEFYLKAYKYNPENAELNYKIGVCYLNSIQKVRCIEYFEKAFQLKPNVAEDIHYMIGQGYHIDYKFDEAIEQYKKYEKSLSPHQLKEKRSVIEKHIQECENGKELKKKPVRVLIENMGPSINTFYPEYSPFISADQSVMIFTSRRDDTRGGKMDPADFQYYEDIYVTYKKDGRWTNPRNFGRPINSKKHDATAGLAPDGQKLYVYQPNNGGDIYVCKLKRDKWSSPRDLPNSINTSYHEESASLSPSGILLYFSSDREGGYGEHDIYTVTKNVRGKWRDAVNIGNMINTPFDERSVFIHPDGRTLFFSSTGHNSMGGYDIFMSVKDENGTWSKPENMGYPINTPEDDLFFVVAADGRHAYYASDKQGGYGDEDLYKVTFLSPERLVLSNEDNLIASVANPLSETMIEESVKIKKIRLTIVKGKVKDAITMEPVEADIEIVDNEKNELIAAFTSNGSTGDYLISLPSGKNYGIAVKAEGYLFHSENFNIPKATSYQEIQRDIHLVGVSKGSKVVLNNIFFEYAKAKLRSESYTELNRLVKVLNDNPNLNIKISGHTDNRGTYEYNLNLSKNRAKAVVDYLVEAGISAERLESEGYADTQPVATNDTDEGRQQNRRVEFEVIKD